MILARLQLSLQQQDQCPARPGRLTVPCSLPSHRGRVTPSPPAQRLSGCVLHLFSTVLLALGSISDWQPPARDSPFIKHYRFLLKGLPYARISSAIAQGLGGWPWNTCSVGLLSEGRLTQVMGDPRYSLLQTCANTKTIFTSRYPPWKSK